MRQALIQQGAKVIIDVFGDVKAGEKVLILCDSTTETLSEGLAAMTLARGAEPFVLTMVPRKIHGEEMPAPVAAAMKAVDVVIAPTKTNVAHTNARFSATKAGVRVVVLPEFTEEVMTRAAMFIDFNAMRPRVEAMAKLLTDASVARITSKDGSNFTCSLIGRKGRALHGISNTIDISAGCGIESSIAPVEDGAEGVLVCNASIPGVGLVDEPIYVYFEKGMCVDIKGGRVAKEFYDLLKSKNDPKIFTVAELGIGMNPAAVLANDMLSDESVYGYIHVAVGTNAYIGGVTATAGHYDMVMKDTTLELDGRIVVSQNEVLV